jgi:hypothetical protein
MVIFDGSVFRFFHDARTTIPELLRTIQSGGQLFYETRTLMTIPENNQGEVGVIESLTTKVLRFWRAHERVRQGGAPDFDASIEVERAMAREEIAQKNIDFLWTLGVVGIYHPTNGPTRYPIESVYFDRDAATGRSDKTEIIEAVKP